MMNQLAPQPDGVLGIWKPAGWTSHDVVAKARRILGVRRIGHTGTLDPAVTGVLPLCIGRATRFVEYLQEMPKTYEASLRFGLATDTQDLSGNVTETADVSHLSEERIAAAVHSFIGEIAQVPPMVSAVKVNGKRLYELARQGLEVERKPRKVVIHDIHILNITIDGDSRPEVRFSVRCSKGTYIRTLCADIGQSLGVPAVMASLVRTESAGLVQADCVTLEQLTKSVADGDWTAHLIRADRLLTHYPRTTASWSAVRDAVHGKKLAGTELTPMPDREGLWLVDQPDGTFLGIFAWEQRPQMLRAVKVFATAGG